MKSAYLQPARGGNVAWLRLPAFLVDLPDFVFAQNFVARFVSKWTVAVDKRLEKNRIFGATLHFGPVGKSTRFLFNLPSYMLMLMLIMVVVWKLFVPQVVGMSS